MSFVWFISSSICGKLQTFYSWSKNLRHLFRKVSLFIVNLENLNLSFQLVIHFIAIGSLDSTSNATMYAELNGKIEQMTELMYFAVVKLTPVGVMMPALIITIVNYYLYDLDDESFFLPLLVMYVSNVFILKFLFRKH